MRLGWEEINCIFVDMDDVDLPVMIPDLDIWRSANVLVKRHGRSELSYGLTGWKRSNLREYNVLGKY